MLVETDLLIWYPRGNANAADVMDDGEGLVPLVRFTRDVHCS